MSIEGENRFEAEEDRNEEEALRDEATSSTEAPPEVVTEPESTHGHPESATADGPYVSEDGATMGRDFVIPGVNPREHDPYKFHTGVKRDHGGEDAIEIIDLVKQFGRARILNASTSACPGTRSRWC